MKPFDYVNDICTTKSNLMRGTENDELAESAYVPYLTNMALSMHVDTILFANEMNLYHHLPNRAQYEYLLNTVRPAKRYGGAWPKKLDTETLDIVCERYGCNRRIGYEYMTLLSEEQLETMKKEQDKGGVNERRARGSD
jgi:hypothetical protein